MSEYFLFFILLSAALSHAICHSLLKHNNNPLGLLGITSVIEIMGGDVKKAIMIGDSEVDGNSAQNASLPFILLEGGYTNVKVSQIKYDYLIKDFVGLNKIIKKYL